MAEIISLRNDPHDEVRQLLPWLVNKSLDPEERQKVEAHLAGCPDCRAELDSERQLAAAVSSLPLDSESGWERMQQRLDAEPSKKILPAPSLWHRRVPIGWAVASPIAAAAAVALIFVNVTPTQPVDPQYHALGAPVTIKPANLVVQFSPGTRVSDMQDALTSVDARLVDGPTSTGAYLLRVDQQKRELALKQLRDDQAITLAEPIDGPSGE